MGTTILSVRQHPESTNGALYDALRDDDLPFEPMVSRRRSKKIPYQRRPASESEDPVGGDGTQVPSMSQSSKEALRTVGSNLFMVFAL